MKEPKTEKQKKSENDILSAGIMLSLDIENNFKIYSYRIVDTNVFNQRIKSLVQDYTDQIAKLKKESKN